MSTLVSRPGIDAYWGFSLAASQDFGGLFQPGTAVEPWLGVGGEATVGGLTCGLPSSTFTPFTGAVVGGAGVCADARPGSSSAAAKASTPRVRAVDCMASLLSLLPGVAGAD